MNQKSKKFILAILVCFNVFAWSVVYDLTSVQNLEVEFFDVGQGDSIFIETPNHYQVLIDGGPTDIVLEKLGDSMNFWDRKIDVIVSTHTDHDHLAGLIEVLKRYQVDYVLWNGILKDTGESRKWKELLESRDIKTKIVSSGNKIKTPKVHFDVLYPFKKLRREEVGNLNDTSIVLRLNYKDNFFLFTGDITDSAERKIIEKKEVESDVLKVAHHGSKYSSCESFLQKVDPDFGIISVGENNSYGHPAPEVLELLNKYDISILRTDLDGDIEVVSDGKNIKIN